MIRHFAMRAQLVLKVWLAGRFAVVCVFGKKKIKSFLLYAHVSLKKKRKDKRLGEGGGDGGYSSWVLFL
jgi:hypothetical protein